MLRRRWPGRAAPSRSHRPTRKPQVGSGDRSQRIRTYNYPQGRITDHRVEGLTLYDLPNVLDGGLDPLVDRLAQEHQAEALARMAESP